MERYGPTVLTFIMGTLPLDSLWMDWAHFDPQRLPSGSCMDLCWTSPLNIGKSSTLFLENIKEYQKILFLIIICSIWIKFLSKLITVYQKYTKVMHFISFLCRYKRENLLLLGIADHEPKDCSDFYEPLVSELDQLARTGLSQIEGHPKVFLLMVTADLPAKKKVISDHFWLKTVTLRYKLIFSNVILM